MECSVLAERRRRVAQALREAGGGVAVLPTAPERIRNRDTHHPYRFDSYFYYLGGFSEPEAWLVIDDQGHTTLLCRPRDAEREIWDGYRVGPEAAPERARRGCGAVDRSHRQGDAASCWQTIRPSGIPSASTRGWRAASTSGWPWCAPGSARVSRRPVRSATSAACSTRCGSSRTRMKPP